MKVQLDFFQWDGKKKSLPPEGERVFIIRYNNDYVFIGTLNFKINPGKVSISFLPESYTYTTLIKGDWVAICKGFENE